MTQIFTEEGNVIPVTVISAGPCTVVHQKTVEADGYTAVKLGFEDIKKEKINKPELGLFEKIKVTPKKYLKEFRVDDVTEYEVGKQLLAGDVFAAGDKIDVSGVSKGKGFQGVIKRHGQSRGPESHGSTYHRRPGSMGACAYPGRVFKGKKLPGHMGAKQITVQNLEVVKVDTENNYILVKGAVPGPKNALLTIKGTVKS
jgi:large subunit ribosomal protein L3